MHNNTVSTAYNIMRHKLHLQYNKIQIHDNRNVYMPMTQVYAASRLSCHRCYIRLLCCYKVHSLFSCIILDCQSQVCWHRHYSIMSSCDSIKYVSKSDVLGVVLYFQPHTILKGSLLLAFVDIRFFFLPGWGVAILVHARIQIQPTGKLCLHYVCSTNFARIVACWWRVMSVICSSSVVHI